MVLRELKERRLVQIALSYMAIGWAALEVTDQFADRGVLPEILYRIVLIWVLFGFPAALLIGWHHGEKGKQKAPLSEMALLLMLAVMASGMSVSTVSRERAMQEMARSAENPLEMRRIAVTYFHDYTGGEYQYLADGLTEGLITELSQVQGLSVVSQNGSMQFRGLDITADSVARALRAGTLVDGDLERRGNRLQVNIRLLDGQSGQVFRRASVALGFDDGLAARDSVSQTAARLLREWLGEEVRVRESASGTASTAAWSLVQRAEKTRKDANIAFAEGRHEEATALFAAADALLAQAEQLDKAWPDPSVARAAVAYRQAYLLRSPDLAPPFIEAAVTHATEALRRSNTVARAYEIRGTASYLRWLLHVDVDQRERDALLQRARTDLDAAIRFDPLLASAHATLAHMNEATNDLGAAVLAAQKAYETDMYLENAELVLFRLFTGLLEQGSFARAKTWCEEGRRRFPEDYRIASCELILLVTPSVQSPSIDSAWYGVELVERLSPEPRREGERARMELLAGAVIARVGRRSNDPVLLDSARAVVNRGLAGSTPENDPNRDSLLLGAYAWTLIGDESRAVALLAQHAAVDPSYWAQQAGEISWWWRDLQSNSRFRALAGLAP